MGIHGSSGWGGYPTREIKQTNRFKVFWRKIDWSDVVVGSIMVLFFAGILLLLIWTFILEPANQRKYEKNVKAGDEVKVVQDERGKVLRVYGDSIIVLFQLKKSETTK